MTIKEVEEITNLPRSNIRFYEKEKLITPVRNPNNGYREYSEKDVNTIKKIAYLRTLGISVEDIRRLSNKEIPLYEVIKVQKQNLEQQLSELENVKMMCEKMLSSDEKIDYDNLDIEQYITNMNDYCNKNKNIFKMDSVSFIYMWGGQLIWGILTISCLFIALFFIGRLPAKIPIQWNNGVVSSFVDKKFIFAFPVACLIIRLVLRPYIWRWLKLNIIDSETITNYITNYLCFIALSVEVFIILYVYEFVKHITVILFMDTFVLIGGLLLVVCQSTQKK